MTFFRRIIQRFRTRGETPARKTRLSAAALIEQAHRAQHAENYGSALELLAEAMEIARKSHDDERQVDITLVRGDILIAQGDYATAKSILEELYEDCAGKQYNAPMAYALVSLGVVAQRQGNWETAREKYEEARMLAKNTMLEGALGRATARLAAVYAKDGNEAFALHLLQDAIPRLQRSGDQELLSQFLAELGELHIAMGNDQEGLQKLREALDYARLLQDRPQMFAVQVKLGRYADACSRVADAKRHYEEALSLSPNPRPRTVAIASLLCELGDVLVRSGDYPTAAAHVSEALAIAHELNDTVLKSRAEITLGTALLRQDETSVEGRALLQSAVDANRDSANEELLRAMRALAHAEISAGNREVGERLLRDALERAPAFPLERAHIQSSLGVLLRESHPEMALSLFGEALEAYTAAQRPEQVARLHTDIGALHAQQGEGRRALKAYERALLGLNDIQDVPTRGIVLGNVAAAYSEYGDLDSALDFFQQAIEIARETGDPVAETTRRGNYGRLLVLVDEPRKAITELMQAQNQSTELGLTQLAALQQGSLALAYVVLGNIEDGIRRYDAALENLHEPAWNMIVRANLADAYAADGQRAEARAAYQQALEVARRENVAAVVGQCLTGLAKLALADEEPQQAANYLQEAEPILRRAFLRRSLAYLLAVRSHLEATQGDTEKARATWGESQQMQRLMQMPPLEAPWLEPVDFGQS